MSYPDQPRNIPSGVPCSIRAAIWHEVRRAPKRILSFVFGSLVHAAGHGTMACCAGLLARSLTLASSSPQSALQSPAVLTTIGLAAVIVKGLAGIVATNAQSRLATAVGQSLRDAVVAAMLQNGLRSNTPEAIAGLVSRVREIEAAIEEGALVWLRAAVQIVPIAIALWLLSPRLALCALGVLVPFAVLLATARKRLQSLHRRTMHSSDILHAELDDLVRHVDLWRTCGTGDHVRSVVHQHAGAAASARSSSETLRVALSSANETLAALSLVIAVGVSSVWTAGAIGNLMGFAAVFFMAYRPLRDLADARMAYTKGQEALANLSMLAEGRSDCPERELAGTWTAPPYPHLSLSAVGLRVPGRTEPLSFLLEPGESLVVEGATGTGKTTLLRALLGLERTVDGDVRYGDHVIRPGEVGPAMRPFAWVPQEAPVITGTLEDNFLLAGVSRSAGEAALCTLGASNLRHAISTVKLGAGGRPLSGGERRWLALARALASGAPVLLLDEPTVGLDPSSKSQVLEALSRLRGDRTLLIVSHDPDVRSLADRIVVLREHRGDSAAPQPARPN